MLGSKSNKLSNFEQLFKQHYPSLLAYSLKLLNDKEEAEDMIQEVFFSYWKKQDQLEIEQSVASYLYGAIKRKCQNKYRHKIVIQSHQTYSKQTPTTIVQTPLDQLETTELENTITDCLEKMPLRSRQIFTMNRFERKKYQQIADELSISLKTVEAHMSKVLKQLRMTLSEHSVLLITLILISHG
ncbi:MAG: RNA polymerase sigma-70 factor [Reichenbachiella sp.]